MATTAQININVNGQQATQSVQQLNDAISQAGGSTQSLRAQLRQVTQELQGLEPGSARFVELSQRAGQLRDQIKDTSAVISATAGNAVENFGLALTNTVQIGVAGFQALSAAQVLFGSENEEVQKSIQQMTALLNLSQAIQTFGGLGDKLVEIKAGFTPLLQSLGLMATTQTQVAVSTAAADAALVGEAVAAEGAAASTGILATALNAIPFVAIATAVGLLAYNLLSSGESAEEAAKKKEQLTAETEAYLKKVDEENQKIGQESGAYLSLVFQLKNTNANTKERKRLIDEINTTYGTTFKNLKDEDKFQSQLNLSVKEYIALQVLKAKAQAKEKEREKAVGALIKAQEKLNEVEREYAGMSQKQIEDYDLKKYGVSNYSTAITKYTFELDQAQKKAEQFAIQEGDLQKEIAKLTVTTDYSTKSIKTQGETVVKTSEDLKDYESILRVIQTQQENNVKQEEDLYKKRVENFDKTFDAVEFETKLIQEQAKKQYEAVKASIDKELTAKKIKAEEKKKLLELEKLNEANFTKALSIENERRLLNMQLQTIQVLQENEKRIEYLLLEEKALQNEIRFGDGNTTDTKISLYQKDTEAYIRNIDIKMMRSKYANQIDIKEFEKLLRDKTETLKNSAERDTQNSINIANADFDRQIQLEKDRIEAKEDLSVKYFRDEQGRLNAEVKLKDAQIQEIINLDSDARKARIDGFSTELDKLQKQIDKEKDVKKKAALQIQKTELEVAQATFTSKVLIADDLAQIETQTKINLDQTLFNLELERNTRIKESRSQLQQTLAELDIKFEEGLYDEKIKRLDSYLSFVQNNVQQVTSLINQIAAQQLENQTTQLNDAIELSRQSIEAQYAAALISREEYDNQVRQLDTKQEQEELKLKRKNFKTNKALNVANATIDGIRAVLGTFAGTPGDFIIRSIAAGLAAVFAATQVALVSRQQFTAAEGGIVPGQGSGEYDTVPSMLAPGEAVINSDSTRAFLPLLSAINQQGGGRSFMPDLPPTNQPQTFQPVFQQDKSSQQPIRAYVVESDITSSQRRVDRIERAARF